jgi:hypothetical protein
MYWRYIECVIGATSLPALKGEAGRLRCANRRSAANSPCQQEVFADFFIRCALPISGERIAAPIVLAQHKEHKRIGKVRTSMRRASPIVIKLPYNFAVVTGNGNMFNARRR